MRFLKVVNTTAADEPNQLMKTDRDGRKNDGMNRLGPAPGDKVFQSCVSTTAHAFFE
jgi:hypothetical protein